MRRRANARAGARVAAAVVVPLVLVLQIRRVLLVLAVPALDVSNRSQPRDSRPNIILRSLSSTLLASICLDRAAWCFSLALTASSHAARNFSDLPRAASE